MYINVFSAMKPLQAFIFVCFFATVFGATLDLPPEWHQWKAKHGKTYENDHDELKRHIVWQANQKYIDEHNKYADTFGYTLEMNKFGDLVRLNYFAMTTL